VKGDLERLIEGVKGNWWPDIRDVQNFSRHCEGAIPDDVRSLWVDAWGAYHGSLDAALRLHEALLPGSWYQISHWPMPNMTLVRVGSFEGRDDIPARAWLLAILRALAKREEG
jgi:hypothetical protein